MKLVNMTGHPLTFTDGETVRTLDPDPRRVWVDAQVETADHVDLGGIVVPVNEQVVYEVRGLPDPEPGVLLYVPFIVASVMVDRDDLVVGDARLRDKNGKVVAVSSVRFVWPVDGDMADLVKRLAGQ